MSKNKRPGVLITGSAKRLGRAVAIFMAKRGYDVALHYSQSKPEAVKTQQEILKLGVVCELFGADLADERQVLRLMTDVNKSFPRLAVLVNSASIFVPNHFGAQDLTLFKSHWDINFKAPYILACEFKRLFNKGHIINFIDTNVAKYVSQHEDYLLTKKALAEFTRMSAVSWGPSIRVNGISPGMILPPVNNQPDDRLKRANRIPLKRVGDSKYIIQVLSMLLDNEYITGQIIAVDGGEALV